MLPQSEVINYEDTLYVNPETSFNEQNKFIENLRGLQQQQNAEIATDTTNLGTYPASQSNLGGLGGGESYFTARYQTPQTNALVNDLRAANRAQVLTDVLKLNQSIMQQKLQAAQENARKRAAARAAAARAAAAAAANSNTSGWDGNTNKNPTNPEADRGKTLDRVRSPEYTTLPKGTKMITTTGSAGSRVTTDQKGNIIATDRPGYKQAMDGYYYPSDQWAKKQAELLMKRAKNRW